MSNIYYLDPNTNIIPTYRVSVSEGVFLESRFYRERALAGLKDKIAQFERECKEEQAKAVPSEKYIIARQQKIKLMRQTLEACR